MPNIIRVCEKTGQEFLITEEDLDFYSSIDLISKEDSDGLKNGSFSAEEIIGLPTLCPEERQRRRISFRNFITLYKRRCSAKGEIIISVYHEDSLFPVYSSGYWWSDDWTALDYGREFDFNRSFFDQIQDLSNVVPRLSNYNINCEQCDYSTAFASKNCYLIGGAVRSEDCCYGHIVWDSKDCYDNLYTDHSEICSNCTDCLGCYDTHFSTESKNCSKCYFVHDCIGCTDCYGCTNLRNKQYCFVNEQMTKEEYELKIASILPLNNSVISQWEDWFEKMKESHAIFPHMFGFQNENCTGNHIYESKNCFNCFDTKKAEDCKYLYTTYEQKNCYDISFTGKENRFLIESLSAFNSENCKFCYDIHDSSNLLYSGFCFNCKDCIGCIGLRNAQYCILNKQYSKEEYFDMKSKIISKLKHEKIWGQFFPSQLSPFNYNESVVQEYFPLEKDFAISKGYHWREEDGSKHIEDAKKFNWNAFESNIENISDSVLQDVLYCEKTSKPYRIQSTELNFYKKISLPLPQIHPTERHKKRMEKRNPRILFERGCSKCQKNISTTFQPNRNETVCCEECYEQQIY